MPERQTLRRVQQDKREGKAASTQAGEFIREEIHHVREGKHGARSAKQAIAIGLSKARRAGVDLPPAAAGTASSRTPKSAARDYTRGQAEPARRAPTLRRARASKQALKRESVAAGSHRALAKQSRAAARQRSPGERSKAAIKGASTRAAAKRGGAHRRGHSA